MKKTRISNKELCDSYRNMPCTVCGRMNFNSGHHIKTKGSGGPDIKENLIPLCIGHHTEVHNWGITKFCNKHKKALNYILNLNWYFCEYRQKYWNDLVYDESNN